jgi:hypothetical protein
MEATEDELRLVKIRHYLSTQLIARMGQILKAQS